MKKKAAEHFQAILAVSDIYKTGIHTTKFLGHILTFVARFQILPHSTRNGQTQQSKKIAEFLCASHLRYIVAMHWNHYYLLTWQFSPSSLG